MNKDSLERCYKTVLKQRDNYHVSQVELISLVDSLMGELDMAIASKEVLDRAFQNDDFKRAAFDSVTFGKGFIELSVRGVKHLRLDDVIFSCYQHCINTYKTQPEELRYSTSLEF